jgi:hypothetical protein
MIDSRKASRWRRMAKSLSISSAALKVFPE